MKELIIIFLLIMIFLLHLHNSI
uniref:Uncharacterized protein n=1 Tax=Arundo donax TaxID=35708 RepID=A0A0A9ASL4_ARUDO